MDRRKFMLSGALLPLAGAVTPHAASRGIPPASLAPGQETLLAWMKLAGALDDRLVIWWMEGVRYGVVDSFSRTLYGMKIGLFQRYFPQPGGYWKLAMFELTYYTDLTTGRLLERYDNPYTGKTNTVRHVRLGPEIRHQTIDGQLADPDDQAMQEYLHDYSTTLGPAIISGDSLWIPTSVRARIVFPGPKAPEIKISHYTTAMGSLEDARNPELVSAPCSLAFQNVLKWEPWMQMGDHRGHLMSKAAGRKLERIEDMPSDYLEMAYKVHPRLIEDPMATLAGKVAEIRGEDP
ncbi:MAG: hypothetical protein CL799_07550 [Chromatiales bacterium]|jgi:hypothetical protein|nr:hypothetical protein [Chromatiales bacterium]MDP6150842.1 DUF1838 family protein [Gammaproteobacteria bacterium]MDP7271779.1 DUF1838 family protein [Gammaproteobacteria bacterium]HJP05804.1 DUF1838 family protein [Gammaproteobacteria bacterium]